MAIAAVLTSSPEAEGMIRWSILFGLAREENRLVILKTEIVSEREINGHLELWAKDGPSVAEVEIQSLGDRFDENQILKALDEIAPSLLVVGQNRVSDSTSGTLSVLRKIFDRAPCDSVILRLGQRRIDESDQILVPTAGGPHSEVALKLASQMAKRDNGEVVPLYVESEIGEEDGQAVGMNILNKVIDNAGLDRADAGHIKPRIVISNDVGKGIARAAREKPYDLILAGASNSMIVKWKLFGILPPSMFEGEEARTIALIRKRQPVGLRLRQRFERFLTLRIPQLSREERVDLFERLQTQSKWNFDFVTLILLSTGIASLGLIQSSPAVVIGAMLVAPMMTPLLGSGLSLVQGNLPLMLSCLKAILLGFLAALCVGGLFGWMAPLSELTPELTARGRPNLLDFGVAALSGLAASYCAARPGLSSALAGVAIAAALVPPIATVGISIALRDWQIARGAALLFGTNAVAIILASAVTFFAIGIRGQITTRTLWARRSVILLLTALAVLLIPLSAVLVHRVNAPSPITEQQIREMAAAALKSQNIPFDNLKIVHLENSAKEFSIFCRVESKSPASKVAAFAIAEKLQEIPDLQKKKIRVKIGTDLTVEN